MECPAGRKKGNAGKEHNDEREGKKNIVKKW